MTTEYTVLDNPFFPFAEPFSVNVYLPEETNSTNLDEETASLKTRCAAGLELLNRIVKEPDGSQEVFKMVLETGRELGVSRRPYDTSPEPLVDGNEWIVGRDLLATLSWLDYQAYKAAHYASLAFCEGDNCKRRIGFALHVFDLAHNCERAGMLPC